VLGGTMKFSITKSMTIIIVTITWSASGWTFCYTRISKTCRFSKRNYETIRPLNVNVKKNDIHRRLAVTSIYRLLIIQYDYMITLFTIISNNYVLLLLWHNDSFCVMKSWALNSEISSYMQYLQELNFIKT